MFFLLVNSYLFIFRLFVCFFIHLLMSYYPWFTIGLDLCFGRWDNSSHRLTDFGSAVLPPAINKTVTAVINSLIKRSSKLLLRPSLNVELYMCRICMGERLCMYVCVYVCREKQIFFQAQGKVREFCIKSGNF